jgi:hypothetical protein
MNRPPFMQPYGEQNSQLYAFFPQFKETTLFHPDVKMTTTQKRKLVRWFMNSLWSHKKRGFTIDTNITELGELIEPLLSQKSLKCPMCGKKAHINKMTKKNMGSRLTVDIINPNWRIMCRENIRFISHECNQLVNNSFTRSQGWSK